MDACLRGDDGAWEALVRRYGRLVHGIAQRCGLGPDDAADLLQNVYLVIYRNLGLLDEPAALGGWISTIARREAWRMARRRRQRADREGTAIDEATATDPPRAEERLQRIEVAFLVERSLERLDERCRRLLEILFWERPAPSYEEVSERLGMPIGSIGPTRGRCLGKLRRALEKLGWGSYQDRTGRPLSP